MPGLTSTVLIVYFIFGTFRNACADQQGEAVATAEAQAGLQGANPNFARRPAAPGQPRQPAAQLQGAYNLVECYACTSCPDVLANTTYKLCPYSPNALTQGRCIIYAEKYNERKEHSYVRGCASELGSCADIKGLYGGKSQYVELLSCAECEGDRCNGAPRSLVDVTIAVISLVLVPMLGKCTLA